jgi:UDP-N-acetylmuramoyl-L-alanyl-D-glutamate--2,6-diaminopimelate ligase
MLTFIKKLLPRALLEALRPAYHYALQYGAALWYGFPARHMVVIGVTGTKGKSTVSDMVYAILIAAGHKAALASTIRFVTPAREGRNLFKMTMQGRGFIQSFLARARHEGATHAVVEITSEGARQFRHKFLYLDALIVTNIHPEHIESHGSFENYVAAKRSIVTELEHSPKRPRTLVTNNDIAETRAFGNAHVERVETVSESELATAPTVPIAGVFNRLNALAALKVTRALGVDEAVARAALANLPVVRGRAEEIHEEQDYTVVVDYAHTPDSLRALYGAYPNAKICVLGNTGGGRDTWKRPEMGSIADELCDSVILTNEDPYDEDPRAIVDAMAEGMKRTPVIIMDRREAIRHALSIAKAGDAVLITGKGTDPYIMGARGSKEPWDDATVVREELHKRRQKT